MRDNIRVKVFKNGHVPEIEKECNEFCSKNDIISIDACTHNNYVSLIVVYKIKKDEE